MNNYQNTIAKAITIIHKTLHRYDEALAAHGRAMQEIQGAIMLSDIAKEQRREKAAAALSEAAELAYKETAVELAKIQTAALALEQQSPLDCPELAPAVAIASSAGSKLDEATTAALVKPLIGHKQALIALRSVYAGQGIASDEVNRYIFDAGDRCEKLIQTADGLISAARKGSLGGSYKLAKELEAFAELMGVEIAEPFTSQYEGAYMTDQVRRAMGLR